jgi:hypothetical protein
VLPGRYRLGRERANYQPEEDEGDGSIDHPGTRVAQALPD